jgi:hypothetical protein
MNKNHMKTRRRGGGNEAKKERMSWEVWPLAHPFVYDTYWPPLFKYFIGRVSNEKKDSHYAALETDNSKYQKGKKRKKERSLEQLLDVHFL